MASACAAVMLSRMQFDTVTLLWVRWCLFSPLSDITITPWLNSADHDERLNNKHHLLP
jgi:hypothetical protein